MSGSVRTMRWWGGAALVAGGALVAGCGPMYVYGQVTSSTLPAKPPGCHIQILQSPPDKPYEEVGIFAPKDVQFGSLAGGPVPFQEDTGDRACAAGGDAVVIEKNWAGNYARGTLIKYK